MSVVDTPQRRKKRSPSPKDLGFLPVEAPPPEESKKRSPSPKDLGFEPITFEGIDTPPPASGKSPSPKDLGWSDKPPSTRPPPPEGSSWQEWWDWSVRQAEDAGAALYDFADDVREGLGIDPAKEPFPQDTSRRVPRKDMTESGGTIETLIDYLVPDPVYDFVTSKRTQSNLQAGADATIAGTVIPLLKAGKRIGQKADEFLDSIGFDLDYWQRSDEEKDEHWKAVEDWLGMQQQHYAERAASNRQPDGERTVIDALTEVVPMVPVMVAEYAAAGAALGPVLGFAAVDSLTAWGDDKSPDEILWAGVKGAAMGQFLEWMNVVSRPLRAAVLAPAGGGLAWAEGANDVDIIANSIVFPILGVMPKSGPISARYLKEHGIMPDIRDLGGHVRDLFGGTAPRAKAENDRAQYGLKRIRAKHTVESTEEALLWKSELETARKPVEGDTEGSVENRVAEANRRHEERLEEYSSRHYNEELPARQAADHTQRRWERAQHPYTVGWQEAPYMRSLHMYERDVVVVNVDGVRVLTQAKEDGDARFAAGMERAAELRRQAEAEPDQQARRRLEQLADHVENETFRVVYEIRSGAEDIVEYRVEMAEARASRARYDLAEVIGRRNRVDGRRATQQATDRDLQDAYRAGLRKVTRSNRRARELLKKGDEHVDRTQARLKRDGITEENPETKSLHDRVMEEAYAVRDMYRDAASFELYEGQSNADGRVFFAKKAYDQAHAPQQPPNAIDRIRELFGWKRKKNSEADEETSPEDARKPDDPNWDRPIHDPVAPAPNFEARYKALMIHARSDPHLGRIQTEVDHALNMITDPTHVFPAINYIAKQREYIAPSRRGKQTAELRRDLAKRLGMTSDEFLESPYGKAFNDYEIEAIIMIVDRQWARVQRSYEVWRKTGSQNAFQQYQAELYRFMMIWERVRGAAAESGRSLRMWRNFAEKYGRVGKPMSDLEYKMLMSGDMAAAGKMLTARAKGGWFDMLIEYYINGLISGPATAMVNIWSGITMVGWTQVVRPTVAATVGALRYFTRMTIGRFLYKPFRAIYRTGIRMFGSKNANKALDIRKENEKWMPGGTEAMEASAHRVRFGEVGARVRGLLEGFFLAVPQFFKTLFLGDRFLGEATYGKGMGEHIPWWLGGGIIRIPGRILQAIDDFFKVIIHRSSIRGHAYRLAMAEYHYTSQGWKDLRDRRTRYKELVKHPPAYVKHLARQEALEGTFQNTIAPEWAGVAEIGTKTPVIKVLVPFVRTLLNSMEFVIKGTPAFFMFRAAREAVMGKRGRAAQDTAIAQILMVTGGAAIVFAWALGDNVAPPYPKDQKGRTIQGVADVPPLSVRIPGSDDWIQINRIDPLGAIISLGSSAANAYKYAIARGDEKAAEKSWSIFVASLFSMVADRSGFKGLMDFFQAFQGGVGGQDSDAWTRWFNKTIATIAVPQVVATWARTKDPVIRRAETLLDHIAARTPGEREKLPPVRNIFGDQIVGYDSYGDDDWLDYIMPIYWGRKSDDPATKVLQTLFKIYDWAPGQLQREIAGRELTPEEYDYYQVQAGKYTFEGVSQIANSPEWKRALELDKQKKALRLRIRKVTSGKQTPATKAQAKDLQKQFDQVSKDLARLRYQLLQRVKAVVSKSRAQARNDTAGNSDQSIQGRFPDIWKRKKNRDDFANTGEEPSYLPSWFEQWMEGETPQDDWDAQEAKASEDHK